MVRRLLFPVFVLSIAPFISANALFMGQLRGAETLGWGSFNLSTGLGIYEDALIVFGQVRYGIASSVDITGTLGIMDHDATSGASILLGSDFQVQITDTDRGRPLDIAIGGLFQYYSLDRDAFDMSVWSLGANLIMSKPVRLEDGFRMTPYGRLNMRVDNANVDRPRGEGDNSEFNIGVSLGSMFHFSRTLSLSGEVQFDDQIGFVAAINFFMW